MAPAAGRIAGGCSTKDQIERTPGRHRIRSFLHTCAILQTERSFSMELAIELQKIYDSEINMEIGWLWDGGIDVRLGDKMNGYLTEQNVSSVSEILPLASR